MLRMFVKSSPLKLKEISETLGVESSSLSKILKGGTYATHKFYDDLYDILESVGGISPRRNNVTLYPCGSALGSFEIFIDGHFIITMVFINEYDILRFLNEDDGRLQLIKNFYVDENEIKFENKINSRGKNWTHKN